MVERVRREDPKPTAKKDLKALPRFVLFLHSARGFGSELYTTRAEAEAIHGPIERMGRPAVLFEIRVERYLSEGRDVSRLEFVAKSPSLEMKW